METFDFFPLAIDHDAAISHYTIHIEDEEFYPCCLLPYHRNAPIRWMPKVDESASGY